MAAETGQSPRPLDLAIIGGGISGITLAIALYKRGVSCTVYEAAPELTGIRGAVPISYNALRAMEQIDRCVLGAYNLASTRNQSVSKRNVWCDFVDGMSPQPATHLEPLFSIIGAGNVGHNVVPCVRFLDELVRLLPRDTVRFEKELKHVLDDRIGSGKRKNRHCMTYPVDQGQKMSFLAFVTNDREGWPSDKTQCLSTTKAEALDDFRAFGPNVKHIIKLATGDFERWAIFDLSDYTLSSYFKDRICLLGEAAHGSSPHHEAGASLCIEDAAVLASLLSIPEIKGTKTLEKVFAAYDANRRDRTQWHVQSSRRAGNLAEYLTKDVGKDIVKLERELNERLNHIWNFDIEDSIREATKDLRRRLSLPGLHKYDSQKMPWFLNEHNGLETQ
ncbi:hypothetical protein SLS64_012084 [Diaporthe eres]